MVVVAGCPVVTDGIVVVVGGIAMDPLGVGENADFTPLPALLDILVPKIVVVVGAISDPCG